jgi:hypothetical protein
MHLIINLLILFRTTNQFNKVLKVGIYFLDYGSVYFSQFINQFVQVSNFLVNVMRINTGKEVVNILCFSIELKMVVLLR